MFYVGMMDKRVGERVSWMEEDDLTAQLGMLVLGSSVPSRGVRLLMAFINDVEFNRSCCSIGVIRLKEGVLERILVAVYRWTCQVNQKEESHNERRDVIRTAVLMLRRWKQAERATFLLLSMTLPQITLFIVRRSISKAVPVFLFLLTPSTPLCGIFFLTRPGFHSPAKLIPPNS